MKKYIQVENGKVMLIHHMPFDPVNGLRKSEEELRKTGVLLDEIPEPEERAGKIPVPYYNETEGFYYEYEDAPSEPASTAEVEALSAKIDYIGMMTEIL